MLIFYIDFDLIFGIFDREINFEAHVADNQVTEAFKHIDDSTIRKSTFKEGESSTNNAYIEGATNIECSC